MTDEERALYDRQQERYKQQCDEFKKRLERYFETRRKILLERGKKPEGIHDTFIDCPSCGYRYNARLTGLTCPVCNHETDIDELTINEIY